MGFRTAFLPSKEIKFNGKFSHGKEYLCIGSGENPFIATEVRELCEMEFSIKKVISIMNGYAYAKINIINYQRGMEIPHCKNVTIEGAFSRLYEEAEYTSKGYWHQVSATMETFVITSHKELLTSSISTTHKYMKYVLKGKHYPDKLLMSLLKDFGLSLLNLIRDGDKILLSKVKQSRLDEMQKLFSEANEKEESFNFLIEQELCSDDSLKVIEQYGSNALVAVKNNPYRVLDRTGVSFAIADKLALNSGVDPLSPMRIEAAICAYIKNQIFSNGDLYADIEDFKGSNSRFENFILYQGSFVDEIPEANIELAMNRLKKLESIVFETVSSKVCVYLKRFHTMECFVSRKLLELSSQKASPSVYMTDSEINMELASNKTIDPTQREAVIAGLQNRFSVITGGPGTGKTQTIKAIVDALLHKNPSAKIDLCAPTGKASQRMKEVIGFNAQTLHRRLKFSPTMNFDEDLEEIASDLIIIDESSMIDIMLFYVVLNNISDKTNVILVGDHNQIPSVGPGLILRDIIDSGVIKVTKLTKIFRQKNHSGIIDASQAILGGRANEIIMNPNKGDFKFFSENDREQIITRMTDMITSAKGKINKHNFQILTTTNDGQFGTLGLNKVFQEILNPKDSTKQEVCISPTKIFREGDKVIHIENNYDLEVFNGDVGFIANILPKKNLAIIDFDGKLVEYSFKQMHELMLAYAITVHKSQGSEFEFVMMPIIMSKVDNMNIYYTAITRAKKQMIMIGSQGLLSTIVGINGRTSMLSTGLERKSNIKEKLKNP